ncbi:glycosyltransferase [Maribacter sp. 1_MG-2023]|uniref:glycosyltransferase n=1 Tax=Maribacter sp. 1_MG-2023 TaxID=3062677 RepID=UPI0026E2B5F1|nr:glycosyltransferase [Maribacter sp. 1_MG-2023]MDO6472186.1 glycosyltransferase [Maribacter sp. 1_MG-2023]
MTINKKNIVQINVESNFGSTGKICVNISDYLESHGNDPHIAHGPIHRDTNNSTYQIGTKFDYYLHILNTRIFDKHGLGSKKATKEFLKKLKNSKPDLIHLHNIHGYYINYELLFQFIKETEIPVVWTLHDCWSFTGHCTHFEYINCEKYKTACTKCPLTNTYPKSWLVDRSLKNFNQKKESFIGVKNLTIVPVSKWLATKVEQSFLSPYPIRTITNGIDINTFKPIQGSNYKKQKGWEGLKIILGVASVWDKTKGWEDFIKITPQLKDDERIILVGLSKQQIETLPKNIIGIERTDSKEELIKLYSLADVFMNLTYADTYPTTNLEALACGTPVITYKTGGSVEEITDYNGAIVEQGNYLDAYKTFENMGNIFKKKHAQTIRNNAIEKFDKNFQLKKYDELYQSLLN